MAHYRISGTVAYTTVYRLKDEVREIPRTRTFCREIDADTPKEAFEKIQASVHRKYKSRPNFSVQNEDIRITEYKMYELREITEL